MPGEVCFYLKKYKQKKANNQSGECLIYLRFKYAGNVFLYSFDETINPAHWNYKRQRVKESIIATAKDGKTSLNDLLENLKEVLVKTYNSEVASGTPPKLVLKIALDNYRNQKHGSENNNGFFSLLDRFITGEIKHKGKEKSGNTIKTYRTLQGHLIAFKEAKKYPIQYESLDLAFLYKYITFLREKGLGQNAIAKDVQILKTILKKGFTLGESKNIWFQHEDFTAQREETDSIYLTDKELMNLYRFDFSNDKRLEAIRDLFVFGSYVGLRYSDYSSVKPENIVERENYKGQKKLFLDMITTKTKERVIVPCNPVVLQIFEKYKHNKNRLPIKVENQTFNRLIKIVCKQAGLTEKGRLTSKPELELWECISSHTCRRNFCTNLVKAGYNPVEIRKISGHKSERSFYSYVRLSKQEAADSLGDHWERFWSSFFMGKAVGIQSEVA